MALTLTADERTELERRVRSRKIRAEDARRAQVILMLADGESFTTITTAVGCYPDYVSRWKQRFEAERLAGLAREVSRPAADGADAGAGGARAGEDAADAARWQHALDDAQAGEGAGHQPHAGRADLAPGGAAAASLRALHALG